MSEGSTLTSLISSTPYLIRMFLSLSWMYLTLGRRVRKTRRAFEKQLIMGGMTKKDAVRISACFDELKNSMTQTLRRGTMGTISGL
ncbi:MAG TPA: hypothetical protein VEH86_03045 [Candidatus Acidoferrum sp.]|nr:hypothetical protein [Candidatus Acidoferrum sp.]